MRWKDHMFNVVDTPGHHDFIGEDLLVESDAPEDKLDFPVLQACAKDMPQLLNELLDAIINGVLAPTARVKEPFQMKITAGVLARNEKVKALHHGVVERGKKTIGLETVEIDKGYVGDIISVAVGRLENMQPGETLAGIEVMEPLPTLVFDEPVYSILFTVNDSPYAGRDAIRLI
nr:hypothetical protein [Tanacetum cinerariifolium]